MKKLLLLLFLAFPAYGAEVATNQIDEAGLNAGTADALSANGANCSAGSYPLGVTAAGAVESCTDATTEIDSAISTHGALPNDHHTPTVQALGGRSLTKTTNTIAADAELYTDSETFIIETATTADDLRVKADGAITLTGLDCVATGSPAAQVMTVQECSSANASCATTGLTVTVAAAATNYNDATASNGSIDDNDWWGLDTTSLTTAADLVHCTVTFTRDD